MMVVICSDMPQYVSITSEWPTAATDAVLSLICDIIDYILLSNVSALTLFVDSRVVQLVCKVECRCACGSDLTAA